MHFVSILIQVKVRIALTHRVRRMIAEATGLQHLHLGEVPILVF